MVLPNFLIIGAMKAGTTSLYEYLEPHPEIFMSPVKEPRFFAFENDPLDYRGPDDPSARCAHKTLEAYGALFENVRDERAIGEASTIYLSHPDAPRQISHHIPDAKLIAVLRHPAERAYSQFAFLRRDGREPCADFRAALAAEDERADRLRWGPLWHYTRRGFYARHLARYDQHFPREQIRILLHEDLCREPLGLVKDVCEFLGVSGDFAARVGIQHNVSGVPRNRWLHGLLDGSHPLRTAIARHFPVDWRRRILFGLQRLNFQPDEGMDPEVRGELCALYRDDVLQLQDRIGRDLSAWLV